MKKIEYSRSSPLHRSVLGKIVHSQAKVRDIRLYK